MMFKNNVRSSLKCPQNRKAKRKPGCNQFVLFFLKKKKKKKNCFFFFVLGASEGVYGLICVLFIVCFFVSIFIFVIFSFSFFIIFFYSFSPLFFASRCRRRCGVCCCCLWVFVLLATLPTALPLLLRAPPRFSRVPTLWWAICCSCSFTAQSSESAPSSSRTEPRAW